MSKKNTSNILTDKLNIPNYTVFIPFFLTESE